VKEAKKALKLYDKRESKGLSVNDIVKEGENNMSLELYKKRYEDIIYSDLTDRQKDLKLEEVMTDMEGAFSIPIIKDESWNEENKDVIELFQKVSNGRKF
jgi:hypothetical protein